MRIILGVSNVRLRTHQAELIGVDTWPMSYMCARDDRSINKIISYTYIGEGVVLIIGLSDLVLVV